MLYALGLPLLTFAGLVVIGLSMEPGTIVEYIDRKEIVCAVVLERKNHKIRMLTERNREVSHTEKRLAHTAKERLDVKIGRDALVEHLQAAGARRGQLRDQIDVEALWQVLHTEATWFDLQTMSELCFTDKITDDHTSAVMRAVFKDRLYFKFDTDRFFPNTPEQVARIAAQIREEARKTRMIEDASHWIRHVMETRDPSMPQDKKEVVEILKAYFLFGKDSPQYAIGKQMISRSGLDPNEGPLHLLVRLGVWDKDENLNLHRFGISDSFPPDVVEASKQLGRQTSTASPQGSRRDLTHLSTITIDGQGTLDFDDALSIETKQDGYQLGVHVTDVGHFLETGGIVDDEALARASSIYMPEKRIPMLPQSLAEDLCSLKEGQERPAISIVADLDSSANVSAYEIFPSVVKVNRQLTYYDANLMVQEDPELSAIYELAQRLRQIRMEANAIQLRLPEVNVRVSSQGEIFVSQINRESPSRVMVSECMILANWLTARFFRDNGQPAVFRSQLPPRGNLIGENGGTLYENWMQRRLLSRVVLSLDPEPHAGLGLDAYLTMTSPLRKYLDLVAQRQFRGLLGLQRPYTEEDLRFIIQAIEQPISYIAALQQERNRYWIYRYMERLVGQKEEALVLDKRRQRYMVLLINYMMECHLPLDCGADLKPQDTIMVNIDRANARSDTFSISLA